MSTAPIDEARSAPTSSPLLEIQEIDTYYGESHILHGISLRVAEGEAVGLLGRNGAGKTTTIRSIMSFTPPRRGSIRLRGQEIVGLPAHRVARLGVGLVPQGRRVFPDLSVEENLVLAARSGSTGWTMETALTRFPRLAERRRQLAATLSGGEQQQLAIARALLTNPTLLLMDEPSEGLSPLLVREIGTIVAELKRDRLALVLVEQNLRLALDIVDRVYVLSKGRVVFDGASSDLARDDETHRRYLGV